MGKKLWTRLYRKLFWNGVSKKQIVKAMLKYIRRILRETAGCTGRNRTFTYRKYSWMRDARIICYDEDEEMLDGKKRFARDGLDHVTVKKGNCAKLPFRNESFDAVLSIDRLNAVEDKRSPVGNDPRIKEKRKADRMLLHRGKIREDRPIL